ncbi:MAG: NAD(P)-binding protein [Pirellulaceae bacterium]
MRIAVIGSGIAGLVAGHRLGVCGHEITLFEKLPGIGMDAHAATLEIDGHTVRADVPSRMFNSGLWPRLTQLYRELGVETVAIDTSQSLCDAGRDCYLRSPNTLAPPDPATTWIREDMRGIWADAQRLRRQAFRPRLGMSRHLTLETWLAKRKFSSEFIDGLLFPTLASTVCTCSFQGLKNYPVHIVLETLRAMAGAAELRRTRSGTKDVVQRLTRSLHEVCLQTEVTFLRQDDQTVKLGSGRHDHSFDHVIVATQANTALEQFGWLTEQERMALESFDYETIPVVIHRDESLMPVDREVWSTFNMLPAPCHQTAMCTVWLNRFHHDWPETAPVFQTINAFASIEASSVLASIQLQRPVVNERSLNGQKRLRQLHRDPERRIWFCGSYAGTGTPLLESAVESADHIVSAIEALSQIATTR